MPCYNEAKVLDVMLDQLSHRVAPFLGPIGHRWALMLVDDGSTDATWDVIQALSRDQSGVCGIRLSQNAGQQAALLCGYQHALAQWIVTLDADLQDPPEAIEAMLVAATEGADVVIGHRQSRRSDTWFKRHSATLFYTLMGMLGASPVSMQAGDFRLMSQRAVDSLVRVSVAPLFHRFSVVELGFAIERVEFDRQSRLAGETKYTLKKMLFLAMAAVFSSRKIATRLAVATLVLQSLLTLAVACALSQSANHLAFAWISVQLSLACSWLVAGVYVLLQSHRKWPLFAVAEMAAFTTQAAGHDAKTGASVCNRR